MSIEIRQWPSEHTFYQVFFAGRHVGAITTSPNGLYYWHPYEMYNLLAYANQDRVTKAAEDHCNVLNITARLTK